MMGPVTVIGAGLAGCEAAWQVAENGFPVELVEMKPKKFSPAHQSEFFAELAMVALFGFLKHIQISGKRFFGRVCRAVNSLQHFIL